MIDELAGRIASVRKEVNGTYDGVFFLSTKPINHQMRPGWE
jgi:hypothetical protein